MSALDPAGVAAELKIPEGRFRRKWRRMVRDEGFPSPLPGVGLRWSAVLVEAWIATGGRPAAVAAKPAPSYIDEARASLEARYAA
jgi:hypothetical protein